jgi:dolichol-phosphate mannosyltransferase
MEEFEYLVKATIGDSQPTPLLKPPLQRLSLAGLELAAVVALMLITAGRLILAARVQLIPDEAYYWAYSKHPALSYYDHPPMVAWTVAVGTWLFGDSEFGVRFGTIALSLLCSFVLYRMTRDWAGPKAAAVSVLLFAILPLFVVTGFMATPDEPLLTFWLGAMYSISLALRTRRTLYWLFAGICLGGALLSKYTALLMVPSVGFFLALSPARRRWLWRPQPWLALAIGLLLFAPVIWWNARHDWVSFLFQSGRATVISPHTSSHVLGFWLMQLAIITPIPLAVFAVAINRGIKAGWMHGHEKWSLAVSLSLPLFALFFLASWRVDVHGTWTAPAYLSLLPMTSCMTVALCTHGPSAHHWRWLVWAALITCGVVIVTGISSLTCGFPRLFGRNRTADWRQIARNVEAAETELESRSGRNCFILGMDKYNIAAELSFYTREPEEQVNLFAVGREGVAFRYWTDLRKFEGHPAVAVMGNLTETLLAELREHFDKVESPQRLNLTGVAAQAMPVFFVNCYGYHAQSLRNVHTWGK